MTAPDCVAPEWRGVRRLLAVRLDNLGDVLMTTPALAALRQSQPVPSARAGAWGQTNTPAISMPPSSRSLASKACCSTANCALLKRPVARPDWLVTITSR